MSFQVMIHALLLTHQFVFFLLLGVFILMALTFIIRSNLLARIVLNLEKILFGVFGMFKCVNKPTNYSYLGIELESNLATAVCFSVGVWVASLHYAFYIHLVLIGVTSIYVLSSPFLLYWAYPLVLFALRKKCN